MYRWRADTLCRDPLLEVVAKAVVGLQRRITPQILSLGVFSSRRFCRFFLRFDIFIWQSEEHENYFSFLLARSDFLL